MKLRFLVLGMILSFSGLLFSSSASALDLTRTVTLEKSVGGNPYWARDFSNANCTTPSAYSTGAVSVTGYITSTNSIKCMILRDSNNVAQTYSRFQLLVVDIDVIIFMNDMHSDAFDIFLSSPTGTYAQTNRPVSLEFLGTTDIQYDMYSGQAYTHNYYRAMYINETNNNANLIAPISIALAIDSDKSRVDVRPVWWGVFTQNTEASEATLQQILTAVNNIANNSSTAAVVDAVNKNGQQAHQDAQNTQNAINQQTQQQQQQWQQEQDETHDAIDNNGFDETQIDTTNILSLVVKFWAIVTAVPNTASCRVSLPFPQFTGFGNMDFDFCSLSIDYPAILHIIVAVLVILPASVFWYKKIFLIIIGGLA